jgi:5'-nucleotidase
VAFDGDAVLFSDESERIFKAHGLDKFFEHEKAHENTLLDHVCPVHVKFCNTFKHN